jgi:hypothetical protein
MNTDRTKNYLRRNETYRQVSNVALDETKQTHAREGIELPWPVHMAPVRSNHLSGGSDYRKRNAIIVRKSAANGVRHGR